MAATDCGTWREVATLLRERMASGDLPPGAALPSLSALCRELGVSRHTARRALDQLRTEGRVTSWHGRGSFVATPKVCYVIGRHTRFRANLDREGKTGGTMLLETRRVRAPDFVAGALRLGHGAPAFRATLLRLIDGEPAIFARHYYDPLKVSGIIEALRRPLGVTEALGACGISDYMRAETTIMARQPEPREAAALGIPRGQPVLVTRGVNVDRHGRAFELSEAVIRSDKMVLLI